MIAVVAPAAPAIPYALLAISSAIAFVVSWGLLHGWNRTVGSLLLWLADKKISLPSRLPDIQPFGFARDINNKVIQYLGQAVGATEHAMTTSFHRMVGIIQWTGQELAGLATDTYNAIRGSAATVTNTVTQTLDAKTKALVRKLTVALDTVQHVSIPGLRSRVRALEHRIARAAHATAGAIAAPFPRIGRAEKAIKAQGKRLTRVEKLLAAGVGVAFLVKALSKAGLGWLRCRNVNKVGKAVCGMNPGLLEALLFDAALLTLAFNLEEFAEEMQTVTEDAAKLIHKFAG